MSRALLLAAAIVLGTLGASSPSGSVVGHVASAGAPLAQTQVVLRDSSGGQKYTTLSGDDGSFTFDGIPAGTYVVVVDTPSYFAKTSVVVTAGGTTNVTVKVQKTIASVMVSAPRRLAPTEEDLSRSSQTQLVLNHNIIAAQAPLAGASQLLGAAPGVMQASYSSSGSSKGMISLRGFKQGWANNQGVVDNGLFGVTLNGIYLNNPESGIWEPNEVPDLSILSGSRITFGPGDPVTRTFDSLGGTVDFYTILPSKTESFHSSGTVGSYGGQGYHFDWSDPISKHFGVLIAQGRTFTQDFRNEYGQGNVAPGSSYGTFAEIDNSFDHGSLLLFAYSANGSAYRPNLVPTAPLQCSAAPYQPTGTCPSGNPVATVNGFDLNGNPIPGPAYSQQTTGFYSALPSNVWEKTTQNSTRLAGLDFTYDLSRGEFLTDQAWFRHGDRIHVKDFNFDQQGNSQRYEYNNPYSNALGDTFALHINKGINEWSLGASGLWSHYETRNAFWNSDAAEYTGPNGQPTSYTQPSAWRNNDFYMTYLGLFAQDDIHVSSKFEVTPGIRSVSLSTNFENNGPLAFPDCGVPESNPLATPPPTVPCAPNHTTQPNSSTLFQGPEPSLSMRYAFNSQLSAYASYGRAFREPQTSPGGPYQKVSVQGLEPEIADDNELGMKFYQRLSGPNVDGTPRQDFATLGLFQSTLENQTIPISVGNGLKDSSASGASKYSGLTFGFDSSLTPAFEAFGSYGITHALFTNYVVSGVSYSGLPVPQTPVTTANLGLLWQAKTGSSLVTTRLWDQFVGSQPMWDNSALNGYQGPSQSGAMIPSYNIINGSLGFKLTNSQFPIGINLSATNLLNRQYNVFEYISSGSYFGGGNGESILYGAGQTLADPGPPREVQVTLTFGR